MLTIVTKRVAAGAAWLDQVNPGWEPHIDLARLRLSSGCNCTLGQLYPEGNLSGYSRVIFGHDTDVPHPPTYPSTDGVRRDRWAIAHGFEAEHSRFHYDELDEAWTALIKNRFDTGTLSGG